MQTKVATHTPGPWEVTKYGAIVRENSWYGEEVVYTNSGATSISSPANARLIAAAPELLELALALDKFHHLLPTEVEEMRQRAIKKALA